MLLIQKAIRYLLSLGLTMTEIAARWGFESVDEMVAILKTTIDELEKEGMQEAVDRR